MLIAPEPRFVQPSLVSYSSSTGRNWGALIASMLAVPLLFLWVLIEMIGGALVCEGVDGSCGKTTASFFGGIIAIAATGFALAWTINTMLRTLSFCVERLIGNRAARPR